MTNCKKMVLKSNKLSLIVSVVMTLGNDVAGAIPVNNAYINFANSGGDFSSRQATFRVPEKPTTTAVQDGLRLYEVHFAKMIEVTNHFCNKMGASGDYTVYWNYNAEEGKVFMGQYSIACQVAKDTISKFGTLGEESITIDYGGNAQNVTIAPLNLNSKNAQEFAQLVQSFKPACIEVTPKICPGDRLE
jgi:hypothetical protein